MNDAGSTSTKFTDTKDRDWRVAIDIGGCRRAMRATEVDIANAFRPDQTSIFDDFEKDIYLFVEVLYHVMRPTVENAGLSEEQFYEGFDAPTVGRAMEAFNNSLANFIQGPQAKLLKKVIDRAKQVKDSINSKAEDLLESPELEKALDKAVAEVESSLTTGNSSTSSQEN